MPLTTSVKLVRVVGAPKFTVSVNPHDPLGVAPQLYTEIEVYILLLLKSSLHMSVGSDKSLGKEPGTQQSNAASIKLSSLWSEVQCVV